jgi:hypothetical protein
VGSFSKFLLGSSRILEKNIICHVMQRILCKIIFGRIFISTTNRYAAYMHFYVGKILSLQKVGVTHFYLVLSQSIFIYCIIAYNKI